jgi:hypothetical protein
METTQAMLEGVAMDGDGATQPLGVLILAQATAGGMVEVKKITPALATAMVADMALVMEMAMAGMVDGGKMATYTHTLTNEGDSSGHYSGRSWGWGIGDGAGAGDGRSDDQDWYDGGVDGYGFGNGSGNGSGSGSSYGYACGAGDGDGDGEGSGDES